MATTTSTMESSSIRLATTSMPSAAFLLARLEALRTAMLEHFQYIVENSQSGLKVMQVSRDPANDRVYQESIEVDEDKPPSLVQSKMDEVRMDVEVEALIKNCEDLLSLSRVLKEGWVFGALNTLQQGDEPEDDKDHEEWANAWRGMNGWLQKYFERMYSSRERPSTQNVTD